MMTEIKKVSQKPGIYSLKHKNSGKVYIGQTKNLWNRLMVHDCQLKKGTHPNKKLQKAYNQSPDIEIEILEEFDKTIESKQMLKMEDLYIKMFDATNEEKGFNVKDSSIKTPTAEELKEQMIIRREIIKSRQEKTDLTPVKRNKIEKLITDIERDLNEIKKILQILE